MSQPASPRSPPRSPLGGGRRFGTHHARPASPTGSLFFTPPPSPGVPVLRPRSAFSNASSTVVPSLTASRAQAFTQRGIISSYISEVSNVTREMGWDSSAHIVRRRQPWTNQTGGLPIAWQTHTAVDRLNWQLEPHPPWIATSPGAFIRSDERHLVDPRPRTARRRTALPAAPWDTRFGHAHALDRNPVSNGLRSGVINRRGGTIGNLSPSRCWAER